MTALGAIWQRIAMNMERCSHSHPARYELRKQATFFVENGAKLTHAFEHPAVITLRQTRGLCRGATVGTVEAALAGVADGQLRLGALLAAIGELTGEHDLTERAPDSVRALIAEGFFTAVTGTAIER